MGWGHPHFFPASGPGEALAIVSEQACGDRPRAAAQKGCSINESWPRAAAVCGDEVRSAGRHHHHVLWGAMTVPATPRPIA